MLELKPGLTTKRAPAFEARRTVSAVRTVPAPTAISGRSDAIRSIARSAASVRKVISTAGRPPGAGGPRSGTGSRSSGRLTTGMTAACSRKRRKSVSMSRSPSCWAGLGSSAVASVHRCAPCGLFDESHRRLRVDAEPCDTEPFHLEDGVELADPAGGLDLDGPSDESVDEPHVLDCRRAPGPAGSRLDEVGACLDRRLAAGPDLSLVEVV